MIVPDRFSNSFLGVSLTLALISAVGCLSAAEGPEPPPRWALGAPDAVRPEDPALSRGDGRVRWRTWDATAFADARKTNRPVLLFITANWCHRGRVMERSTFTDLEVATRLNEEFIPIRLDRDARPDVDLRAQQMLQALYGSRGWPLTVFLTPEGRVFYGGTYFAVEDDPLQQRQGLRAAIQDVVNRYRNNQKILTDQATAFEQEFVRSVTTPIASVPLEDGLLERAVLELQKRLDAKAGGFAGGQEAAQFPAPRALELCLVHYARTGDLKSLAAVRTTLDAMLAGGIYDRLAGGFHRHTSDRWWRLPRFEKLLVLNAEMLTVLLHAWQLTGDERYREAIGQTAGFWLGLLDRNRLAFPTSVAADAGDHDDGDYYLWSVRDVEAALADETDRRIALLWFGVGEIGEMKSTAPHLNVLHEALGLHEIATHLALPNAEVARSAARIPALLETYRRRRPAPTVDKTISVSGNARMAAALIECGRAMGKTEWERTGLDVLAKLEQNLQARPVLSEVKAAPPPPLLQDRAALAFAQSIAAEELGREDRWKSAALSLQQAHDLHWDTAAGGGYVDRSKSAEADPAGVLAWPVKVFQDTEEPSPNGLMAQVWVRLGDSGKARAAVEVAGPALEKLGAFGATLVGAEDAVQQGASEIWIVGAADDARAQTLWLAAQRCYAPWKVIRHAPTPQAAGQLPAAGGEPFVLVRRGKKEDRATTLTELRRLLAPPAK